jgi:hypothetical protein
MLFEGSILKTILRLSIGYTADLVLSGVQRFWVHEGTG